MNGVAHFDGEQAHGPVTMFLTDNGRIAFVCALDGAYWEGPMPQLDAPKRRASMGGVSHTGADTGVGGLGCRWAGTGDSVPSDAAVGLSPSSPSRSGADVLDIARRHLR